MRKVLPVAVMFLFLCSLGLAMEPEQHSRGWLGVTIAQAEGDTGGKGEADSGARIISVLDDSPALRAGLESKDIITRIDGEEVDRLNDLLAYLRATEAGDSVRLTVLRDGQERSIDVELGEKQKTDYIDLGALKHLKHLKGFGKIFEGGCCGSYESLEGENSGCRGSKSAAGGYLGIHMQELTPELRSFFGSEEDRGIVVSHVVEDSPADHVGLAAGDVILAINGEDIGSTREVQRIIRKLNKDEEARLTIIRRGKEMDVSAFVGERKKKASACRSEKK